MCLWLLPEVLAARRGTKLTWLLLNMFYHRLNLPADKKRRGRLGELGMPSCLWAL